MDKNVKLSIVTPCYNSAKTIKDTLDSVERQHYDNMEHIIIDGVSTDGTLDIVNDYKNRVPYEVRVISEKDNGIYDGMNKGIRNATGELVAIINSDDWYEDDAFSNILDAYKGEKYEIVYGSMKTISEDKVNSIQFWSHEFLLDHMICHPACFVTRPVYEDFGVFDLKYKSSSDYDWMLKRFTEGRTVFSPTYKVITNVRCGGMSASNMGYRETLMLQKEYGRISSGYYAFYMIKSYIGDGIRAIRRKRNR